MITEESLKSYDSSGSQIQCLVHLLGIVSCPLDYSAIRPAPEVHSKIFRTANGWPMFRQQTNITFAHLKISDSKRLTDV